MSGDRECGIKESTKLQTVASHLESRGALQIPLIGWGEGGEEREGYFDFLRNY